MFKRVRAGLAVIAALMLAPQASAINVGGPIVTDTTWTLANSPYIVTSSVIIGANATLTIQPGVTVKVNPGLGITVGSQAFGVGTLKAIGTAAQRITFTSNPPAGQQPQPGQWKDIQFTDRTVDAVFDAGNNYVSGSILQHCVVEYGGGPSQTNVGSVTITQASPFITSCEIRLGTFYGIFVSNSSSTQPPPLRITNSNIHHIAPNSTSTGTGVYIGANGLVFTGNTVSNNGNSNGGSGVYLIANGTAGIFTISGNTFTLNRSTGLYMQASSSITSITGNLIANNGAAGGSGGGMYLHLDSGSAVTVESNSILGNSARAGAGAYITVYSNGNNALLFRGNTVNGNRAVGVGSGGGEAGGLLLVSSGQCCGGGSLATFMGNSFSGNIAQGGPTGGNGIGGGLLVRESNPGYSDTVTLTGDPATGAYNVFRGNRADLGEAIFLDQQFAKNGSNDIQAQYVCWGGQDPNPTVSPNLIYDFFDNPNYAFVVYPPHVEGPNCTTISGCGPGLIADCNGNCAPASWIGDGYCDSGIYRFNGVPIVFNCSQFGNDAGDCINPPPPLLYPPNNAQPVPQPPVMPPPQPSVTQDKLLFVTHGARTNRADFNQYWKPFEMELRSAVDASWQVNVHNWSPSESSHPSGYFPGPALNEAYREARRIALGTDWSKYRHVHLVAHSAGSMLISRLAQLIPPGPVGPTVHCTFLDAYPAGVIWDNGTLKTLSRYFGEYADWADQYYSREGLPGICGLSSPLATDVVLPNAFNVDVTRLDPQSTTQCPSSHRWPVCFWTFSAIDEFLTDCVSCPGTSPAGLCAPFTPYGFGLSYERAGGTSLASWFAARQSQYPVGSNLQLTGPGALLMGDDGRSTSQYQVRTDPPLNLSSLPAGTSGGTSVAVNGTAFTASTTAGAAWINFQVMTTQPSNFLTFNLSFTSTPPGQGVLSVHFDGELIATHDERLAVPGSTELTAMLSADAPAGTHTISFRLDGYGTAASSVLVESVATGFGRFVPPCPADFNANGTVDTPDLTFFLGRFGQPATPGSPAERADFNADGVVNTPDLTFFLGRFGNACP